MARARNIKPDFFKNEHLAECEHGARLLFAGLWCMADREGRLEDRPMRIKADLFPYESPDIDTWLNQLWSKGFIVRYEAGERKYIQIVNFKKHQNPHVKEQASTIPAPDEHQLSHADSLLLIPDSPSRIPEVCVEPKGSPPAITITLNDKTEFPIFESQIAEWETLFPRVDVRQELREMRAWALANHAKRKTSRGVLKFVTSWLAKEQDRGGNHEKNRRTGEHLTPVQKVQRAFAERRAGGEALDSGGADLRGQVDS